MLMIVIILKNRFLRNFLLNWKYPVSDSAVQSNNCIMPSVGTGKVSNQYRCNGCLESTVYDFFVLNIFYGSIFNRFCVSAEKQNLIRASRTVFVSVFVGTAGDELIIVIIKITIIGVGGVHRTHKVTDVWTTHDRTRMHHIRWLVDFNCFWNWWCCNVGNFSFLVVAGVPFFCRKLPGFNGFMDDNQNESQLRGNWILMRWRHLTVKCKTISQTG